MARTHIDPRFVHTKEKTERTSVLLGNLFVLFRPFVEPVVKPKVVAELSKPWKLGGEEYANELRVFAEIAEGRANCKTPAELEADLERVLEILREPPPCTSEQIEAEAAERVDETTDRLVATWLECISLGNPYDVYGGSELDVATVGDDMLPPIGPELAAAFDESFASFDLTPDEARGILRAVRATLPAGKRLPDDAVEILHPHLVTIR